MKKIITVVIALVIGIIVIAPSHKAEAQVVYGGVCCNQAGYRICGMEYAMPIGSGCCCPGVGCGGYVCI